MLRKLPRYIRTKNRQGKPEWLVRQFDSETVDANGNTIETPMELYNRFYRSDAHLPLVDSVLGSKQFLSYLEIPKDRDTIEYDSKWHLSYCALTAEEILERQLPAIIDAIRNDNREVNYDPLTT